MRAREFSFQFAGDPQNLVKTLAGAGWTEAEPANWRWPILSLNPEPTETSLPLLKRDFRGHAGVLVLQRLGGDPRDQETLRLWDSGMRLQPGNTPVYLGQIAGEAVIQRLKMFSYWSAMPVTRTVLEAWEDELQGLDVRWADDSLLLVREP